MRSAARVPGCLGNPDNRSLAVYVEHNVKIGELGRTRPDLHHVFLHRALHGAALILACLRFTFEENDSLVGACVVLVDGNSLKSCTMLALQADGASVTTIEGLAKPDGTLHPMQEMFREHHALHCGFCTPGMVMTAVDLVHSHPDGLTENEIREGLEGNLCRCTGYHNIVLAIIEGAAVMRGEKPPSVHGVAAE